MTLTTGHSHRRGSWPTVTAAALLVAVALAGCGDQGPTKGPATTPARPGNGGSPASSGSPPPPTPPDLSARPLVWFAPLPPLPTGPGREYTGSDDFMGLFAPGAAWDLAASRVQVFKLYGEWVAYDATDDELRTALAGIAARGMAVAVEMGPLDATAACGQGVESFAGVEEGRRISDRIAAAGGTLQIVAMDEPYYYGAVYDGPNACHWTTERIAEGVTSFVQAMRSIWPGLVVGDTEPSPAPVSAAGLADWMDAYRVTTGEALAFLHLDVDWSRAGWPALDAAVRKAGSRRGVPIGMIYNGGAAASDAAWVALAGRRVLQDEGGAGGPPDHVLFQSWMDKPDHVLPETNATTFTGLIDRYFDDHLALGMLPGGPLNLALDKPATASSSTGESTPGKAVDGDPDTLWSAGAAPPAWIQIDLGKTYSVSLIRLTVSQFPNGRTRHEVSCASTAGGTRHVLATISGTSHDLDVLSVTLDRRASCRILRIETLISPSWVAWREIEVRGAP